MGTLQRWAHRRLTHKCASNLLTLQVCSMARLLILQLCHPCRLTYNYGRTEYTKGNAYAQVAISTKVCGVVGVGRVGGRLAKRRWPSAPRWVWWGGGWWWWVVLWWRVVVMGVGGLAAPRWPSAPRWAGRGWSGLGEQRKDRQRFVEGWVHNVNFKRAAARVGCAIAAWLHSQHARLSKLRPTAACPGLWEGIGGACSAE